MITYAEYSNFNGPRKQNDFAAAGKSVRLSSCVNGDNQDRSLVMRGLPYKIDFNGIQNFFADIELPEEGVFIEENNGRRTGSALVVFENEEVA